MKSLEYEGKIMVAPTLNLEKPVSFGATNSLGPGGTADPSVVVSKIEEVQTRIGSAKAEAKAHYAVLESARKLNSKEYTFHPQLGYISLNQRLSNDEILGVAFQYTYLGKVYRVGEFANGDIPGTSIIQQNQIPGQTQVPQQIQTNNLIVKMLKSSLTDVRQLSPKQIKWMCLKLHK